MYSLNNFIYGIQLPWYLTMKVSNGIIRKFIAFDSWNRYSSSSSTFTPVLFIIIAVRVSRHGEYALFEKSRPSEIVIHDVPGAINVEDIVAYHL